MYIVKMKRFCVCVSERLCVFFSQNQVESLEESVAEKDKLNGQLQASLNAVQTKATPSASQAADISTQSPRPPHLQPTSTVATPATDEGANKPAPPPAAPAEVRLNEGKRFPSSRERIRSPVKRGLRVTSPKTSSGDLLDSSLDNEMRAVGVEFNDSFDSSEGVAFSDSNLDASMLSSDHSLPAGAATVTTSTPARDEGGERGPPSGAGNDHSLLAHKIAWKGKEVTSSDQAQATAQNSVPPPPHEGADGQGALSDLIEGVGSVGEEEEVGPEGETMPQGDRG